jgi:hypothetical protein
METENAESRSRRPAFDDSANKEFGPPRDALQLRQD